jgi:hypothetical protein
VIAVRRSTAFASKLPSSLSLFCFFFAQNYKKQAKKQGFFLFPAFKQQ